MARLSHSWLHFHIRKWSQTGNFLTKTAITFERLKQLKKD